jgi:hypothetical protein
MRHLFVLLVFVVDLAKAGEPFAFDSQLAVELSVSYVHSHLRQRPGHTVPGITFEKPVVVGVIDGRNRHLVIVSFASRSDAGAYVVFEGCTSNGLLIAAESGTVNNIERYRKDMASITPKTFVAIPSVCPAEKK